MVTHSKKYKVSNKVPNTQAACRGSRSTKGGVY